MTMCYNCTLRRVKLSVLFFQKKNNTRQLKILNHGWKIKQNNLLECLDHILNQNLPGVNIVIHEYVPSMTQLSGDLLLIIIIIIIIIMIIIIIIIIIMIIIIIIITIG